MKYLVGQEKGDTSHLQGEETVQASLLGWVASW